MTVDSSRFRIVLVAGETSGDNLGAALIQALRERLPNAEFAGIAGPRMAAAGCAVWESADSLAVMGIFEILPHLRRRAPSSTPRPSSSRSGRSCSTWRRAFARCSM